MLSDQSDPFNRSLLTMDMVTSNTELKERIENWLVEKKSSHTTSPEKEESSSNKDDIEEAVVVNEEPSTSN